MKKSKMMLFAVAGVMAVLAVLGLAVASFVALDVMGPHWFLKRQAVAVGLVASLAAKAAKDAVGLESIENQIVQNANIVRGHLRKEDFKFHESRDEEKYVFQGSICGDGEIIDVFNWRIMVEDACLQSFFSLPTHCSEKKRGRMAEFINLVNWPLRWGKLTMDAADDGELMFHMCVPSAVLKGDADEEVDRLIGMPTVILSRFTPGVIAVLMGKSPLEAYKMCDGPDDDDDSTVEGDGDLEKTEPEINERSGRVLTQSKNNSSKGKLETAACQVAANYSLSGLHVVDGVPLEKVVSAVKKFREGKEREEDVPRMNILISGPSGCGKSEFVRFLSKTVHAPLVTVSASDILSPMVGRTEQKIAAYFRKAKETGSILFLDEIDSILLNRETASHSWEFSMTTELMLNLENFGGIAIAATNFEKNLDSAVLRRFTLKLHMGYLTNEAKVEFFTRYFKTSLSAVERARLDGIELVPGDYRCARQKLFYTSDKPDNNLRLAALESESAARGPKRAKIGF